MAGNSEVLMTEGEFATFAKSSDAGNYSALDGKPQINSNVVVSGNQTGASLGLVDISSLSSIESDITSSVISQMVDLFYPVGSIFISTSNTNPETLFPGTNWQPIHGRFLVAEGDNQASSVARINIEAGALGGLASIPLYQHTHSIGNHTHTISHTHPTGNGTHFMYYNSGVSGASQGRRNIGSGSGSYYAWTTAKTDALLASTTTGSPSNTHSGAPFPENNTTGYSAAFKTSLPSNRTGDNLPPYLAVYMWERLEDSE